MLKQLQLKKKLVRWNNFINMSFTDAERNKLSLFFKQKNVQIQNNHLTWKDKTNNHILLVDGNNLFLRGYCASTNMDRNGNNSGGVVASLKSLGYAIKLLVPSRVIVIFDGVGGSVKRKQLYPDYKAHRSNKIRLNRIYEENSTSETEDQNKQRQYLQFINYLQVLPLNIVSENNVEADDVIAYLALDYFKSSKKVTIFSSDKDFLQLCDQRINVYSATKKRIYGVKEVVEEYNIHPNNYVLYRAMDGDESDNIPGIDRAGLKTICKHFPYLKDEQVHTIDEIVKSATDLRNKFTVCENITSNRSVIGRNYALMQLKDTALGTTCQLHLEEILNPSKIPLMDRNMFFQLIRKDGLSNNMPDYNTWIGTCFDFLNSAVRTE